MTRKRRLGTVHKGGKKKQKVAVVVREQVLPKEALLDIFTGSKRFDVDNWNVVSRHYAATVKHVQTLRPVEKAQIYYDSSKKVHRTVFQYKDETGDELELRESYGDVSLFLSFVFNVLRHCCFMGPLEICNVLIDTDFVDRMAAVKQDFQIEARHVILDSYYPVLNVGGPQLADGLNPIDVLKALPSSRSVIGSALRFLESRMAVNDNFLCTLASRGIRELGHFNPPGIQATGITEKGILDFCFGAYENDGKERLLHLDNPQLSPQFISKFVQVSNPRSATAFKIP